MDTTVTIYTKGPGCRSCTLTEQAFRSRGIQPRVIAIASDDGQAAIARLPQGSPSQAPVVTYDDTIWSGMRPDLIEEVTAAIRSHALDAEAGASRARAA